MHLSPALHPVLVCRIDTREDANIHSAIARKYLSNCICTVVEERHHGYFCLGYFFSSTHFDLVTSRARKVWRLCVLVFAHDRYAAAVPPKDGARPMCVKESVPIRHRSWTQTPWHEEPRRPGQRAQRVQNRQREVATQRKRHEERERRVRAATEEAGPVGSSWWPSP